MTTSSTTAGAITSPVKLAHFVLRTSRYAEVLAWYQKVLGAHIVFENSNLAFLTYDDEHHRLAVLHVPNLADAPNGIAGVHHIAFTYGSLHDLLSVHERLKEMGITPVLPINHGPTTSIYYADPDGNQLEFQVENFDTLQEADAFFHSPAFAENPIGVEFDPAELFSKLQAGTPEAQLKKRPDVGARGLDSIPLR